MHRPLPKWLCLYGESISNGCLLDSLGSSHPFVCLVSDILKPPEDGWTFLLDASCPARIPLNKFPVVLLRRIISKFQSLPLRYSCVQRLSFPAFWMSSVCPCILLLVLHGSFAVVLVHILQIRRHVPLISIPFFHKTNTKFLPDSGKISIFTQILEQSLSKLPIFPRLRVCWSCCNTNLNSEPLQHKLSMKPDSTSRGNSWICFHAEDETHIWFQINPSPWFPAQNQHGCGLGG